MDSERKDGFDRDDPLWDVLGRASQPSEPSPYFARRVLRDLDLANTKPVAGGFSGRRWFQSWLPVAAAIALLLGAAQFWMPAPVRTTVATVVADDSLLPSNPDQRIATVLADLDELIAFEDTQYVDDEGIWQ